MGRRVRSQSSETKDISRALRRAALNALELGIKTGTPVYVIKNNKMVDLTKDPTAVAKLRSRRSSSKNSV